MIFTAFSESFSLENKLCGWLFTDLHNTYAFCWPLANFPDFPLAKKNHISSVIIYITINFMAELWRAKRASGSPWVSKPTHLRKFGNHVTVHRPSVRTTGIPMFTLALSSYFGSPEKADCTSMLSSIDSCQTGYPLISITWPYRGLRCRPIKVEYFLKLSADILLVFKWSQAHVYFL